MGSANLASVSAVATLWAAKLPVNLNMFKYQAKIIVQKFHSFSLIVNLVHMVWLWTLHYFGKHKSQPNDVNRSIDLRISQLLHQTQPPWSKTMENTDIQLAHSRYKNPCLHQKCKFSWRTLKFHPIPSWDMAEHKLGGCRATQHHLHREVNKVTVT